MKANTIIPKTHSITIFVVKTIDASKRVMYTQPPIKNIIPNIKYLFQSERGYLIASSTIDPIVIK